MLLKSNVRSVFGLVLSVILFTLTLSFNTYAYASTTSFEAYMERCEPYREMIESILIEEGVPKEYFALLLAESGCDPNNVSDAGAQGLWQLMPATARRFGVNPFDIEESTRGAARYIASLRSKFNGDMKWVIAAYNAGGSNLRRVTGYPSKKDFSVVKHTRPQAYNLAMKVTDFVNKIKIYDQKEANLRSIRSYTEDSALSENVNTGENVKTKQSRS